MKLISWVMRGIKILLSSLVPIARAWWAREGDLDRAPGDSAVAWMWSPKGGWECMSCGSQRPDEMITVTHLPVPGWEHRFPGTRLNFRHCVDRPQCHPPTGSTGARLSIVGGAGSA